MNLSPKDLTKRSKEGHEIDNSRCQKRVFSKSGILTDFEFKHGFVQGITLETFHQHQATFSSRKIQPIRPEIKIHEFNQKSQIVMNMRRKGRRKGRPNLAAKMDESTAQGRTLDRKS